MDSKTAIILDILFEDEFLIAVNKPNKLLIHHSHYSRNIREISLAQLVRKHCGHKIHPIHRLDRKTSGIVLFAKSPEIATLLQNQFKNQTVEKKYAALIRGFVTESMSIDSPVKNKENNTYQTAETLLNPIATSEINRAVLPYSTARYSLVELIPKTGRTHQLRIHMNKIAHPIIGDPQYGNRHHNHAFIEWFGHDRLFLHAKSLRFEHPKRKERILIQANFPEFWQQNLSELNFTVSLDSNQILKDSQA
ncbi:MAG: pseudouridine synthase [Crocinitomicaceae bacterium]